MDRQGEGSLYYLLNPNIKDIVELNNHEESPERVIACTCIPVCVYILTKKGIQQKNAKVQGVIKYKNNKSA